VSIKTPGFLIRGEMRSTGTAAGRRSFSLRLGGVEGGGDRRGGKAWSRWIDEWPMRARECGKMERR